MISGKSPRSERILYMSRENKVNNILVFKEGVERKIQLILFFVAISFVYFFTFIFITRSKAQQNIFLFSIR